MDSTIPNEIVWEINALKDTTKQICIDLEKTDGTVLQIRLQLSSFALVKTLVFSAVGFILVQVLGLSGLAIAYFIAHK